MHITKIGSNKLFTPRVFLSMVAISGRKEHVASFSLLNFKRVFPPFFNKENDFVLTIRKENKPDVA
jgi:hypothetical protein